MDAERMVQRRASVAARRASLPDLVPTSDRGLKQRMSLGDSGERRASVELSPTKRWRNEFDQVRRLSFAFGLTIADAMPLVRQFHEADAAGRGAVDKDGFEQILLHVAGFGAPSAKKGRATVVDADREWDELIAAAAASEHLNQNLPANPVERFVFAATLESVFAWYVGSHFHHQKRDSVATPPTVSSTPRTSLSEPLSPISPISPGPTTPHGSAWTAAPPVLPPIGSRASLGAPGAVY